MGVLQQNQESYYSAMVLTARKVTVIVLLRQSLNDVSKALGDVIAVALVQGGCYSSQG